MTDRIEVSVKTAYLDEQSDPALPRFVYTYTVTLHNSGDTPARLVSRHWIITDAEGAVKEVQGMGVVGEQPRLKPEEIFSYTSGVVLETQTGTMTGTYQMITDDGREFDTPIPEFILVPPHALH